MTDLELTGDEKYLVGMGYIYRLFIESIEKKDMLEPETLALISASLSKKFTNETDAIHNEQLKKLRAFDVAGAIADIIMEIHHAGKQVSRDRKLNCPNCGLILIDRKGWPYCTACDEGFDSDQLEKLK